MLSYKQYRLADGRDKIISRKKAAQILGVSPTTVSRFATQDTRTRKKGRTKQTPTLAPIKETCRKAGNQYSLRMVLEFAIMREPRSHLSIVRANAARLRHRKEISNGN